MFKLSYQNDFMILRILYEQFFTLHIFSTPFQRSLTTSLSYGFISHYITVTYCVVDLQNLFEATFDGRLNFFMVHKMLTQNTLV